MKLDPKDKIWDESGGRYYLGYPTIRHERLENAIFTVHQDANGRFYLTKIADKYVFDYKIYGLESKFIQMVTELFTQ